MEECGRPADAVDVAELPPSDHQPAPRFPCDVPDDRHVADCGVAEREVSSLRRPAAAAALEGDLGDLHRFGISMAGGLFTTSETDGKANISFLLTGRAHCGGGKYRHLLLPCPVVETATRFPDGSNPRATAAAVCCCRCRACAALLLSVGTRPGFEGAVGEPSESFVECAAPVADGAWCAAAENGALGGAENDLQSPAPSCGALLRAPSSDTKGGCVLALFVVATSSSNRSSSQVGWARRRGR
mmetsp:Transcript_3770/g.11416  ORF Transcript_3770/g.11416 Transcript_3770/m.11416 type:complete len:243 (-) Transcript_3770:333-1061(-)